MVIGAVVIGVENAGIALIAQQDHRISERLEPGLHWGFQRLQRLGVVVLDQGHRQQGQVLHQGAVEQAGHVVLAAAAAGLMEIEVQRCIEQAHLAATVGGIPAEAAEVVGPVFTHHEEIALGVTLHLRDPVDEEITVDVLDGIDAETIHSHLIQRPAAPVFEFPPNLGVSHVQVAAHQEVVVAFLQRHVALETGAVAAPDRLVMGIKAVVIHRIEVIPMPLHCGVAAAAALEAELGPGPDLPLLPQRLAAVLGGVGRGEVFLLGVGEEFVVEHHIGIHLQAGLAAGLHRLQVLLPRSVFGAHAALLVELAQVEEVVGAVAHVVGATALAGRRQPHGGDARLRQSPSFFFEAAPVAAITLHIPVKPLNHRAV